VPNEIPAPANPSLPPLPPRPPAPGGHAALADRLHALRRDPRAGAAALLVVAIAAGGFWFRSGISAAPAATGPATTTATQAAAKPNGAASTAATTSTTVTAKAARAHVVVDVAGAVAKPGVVTLRSGARVVDAIAAAGGAHPDADLDRLNLAARLTDGERIAVPVRGQPAPALDPAGGGTSGGAPAAGSSSAAATVPTPSSPLNVNDATEPQLEALPGIGPSLAAAIIAEREKEGGFSSIDDLRRVRGIGDVRFAQLRPLITV
jgi:competence protein ComEA